LVKFEKGLIEIESSNDFDKDFIKNLSHKLYEWTNYRWIIILSQLKGGLTKNQIEINKNKEFLERIKKTEVYKKILENFPDAQLTNTEKKD
jgi:DNA polymerase-3 subunit gamma/tau